MSFLAPILLGFLIMAGLPLLVHLLTRKRRSARTFPGLMLLRQSEAGRSQRRRLRDRLVLAVRSLGLVAATLAAAGALWHGTWAGGRQEPAVIILDGSASMRQTGPDGTPWARGRAAAGQLLSTLAPRPCAVLIGDMPLRASSPVLLEQSGPALTLLAESSPGAGDGNSSEALARAISMLHGHGDCYFITDLARSSLGGLDPAALPPGIAFHLIDAGGGGVNHAVVGLVAEPGIAIAGRPLTITARVANYGPTIFSARLSLRMGTQTTLLSAEVPPGESALLSHTLTPDAAGWLPIVAELPPGDALRDDDVRCGAIEVRQGLRALVIGDGDRSSVDGALRPLSAALEAAGIQTRVGDSAVLIASTQRYDLLVTAGLNAGPALGDALQAHLDAGGAWLQVVVSDGDVQLSHHLSAAPPVDLGERMDVSGQERGSMALGKGRLDDALLTTFLGRESLLGTVATYRYRLTPGGTASDAEALLTYVDGTVALAERPAGMGRWLQLNCSTAAVDSTLSKSAVLPMVLARLPDALLPRRAAELSQAAGSTVTMDGAVSWCGANGDGAEVALPVSTAPLHLAAPGLYRRGDGSLVAASIPAAESDLRRLDPAVLHLRASPIAAADSASALSPLWPWLLLAVGAALVSESLLAGGPRYHA